MIELLIQTVIVLFALASFLYVINRIKNTTFVSEPTQSQIEEVNRELGAEGEDLEPSA